MTLPTPLRMARAIALFQGWAAGLGVFVMLGVAVLAAGGLRNGAFVALALLFLAGDVLAVSVAVVVAARRLAEGAAWARLLLDVVEGVTIAVGLLAILMGSGVLGLIGVVLGTAVILCLHVRSSNAVFAGQPILPWETSRPQPHTPVFPVPSLPPRRRPGAVRPVPPSPAPPPAARRYSWERTPFPPAARVPRPAALPPAAERTIPPIEPLAPLSRPEAPAPTPLLTPPVAPPPEEPPAAAEPPAATAPAPAAEPPAAAAPTPPPPITSAPVPTWEPRPPPPPVAAAIRESAAPRQGSATVYERRSRASARPARPARAGMPPAPSWGWRRVVIAASLLGAIGGGMVSAIELISSGGSHLPVTGEAPVQQPPRSGALPGGASPAPARPRTERSEPAAAGGVTAVTVTPGGACAAGGGCSVTVRVDLDRHGDTLVAWTLVVVDRCTGRHAETAVTGIPAPASYRFVLSTNQVTVPAWRSPQILAVTTSPARASSQPVVVGGGTGC